MYRRTEQYQYFEDWRLGIMTNAENNHKVGKLQRDKLEAKEYVDVRSNRLGEHKDKGSVAKFQY